MRGKFYKISRVVCLVALSMLLASAVFAAAPEDSAPAQAESAPAQEDSAPAPRDPEKVLARVEQYEIKEKDVDLVLQTAGPQVAMMYDNEQGRRAILDDLVASRLFALSGKKQGLDSTPEFKSALDAFIAQSAARAAIEKVMENVTATDEECKKFYDENPANFTSPDAIRARHILLPDDAASADKTALIQAELAKGVSFDVLAMEHSTEPAAKQSGGDLGFFSKGQMVPEFETAAFALEEPGDVSGPVQSSFGWHIIKLEEKRPASVMPYDEVKPQIEQNLTNEKRFARYEQELETLKKEYKIEMLTDAQ